MVKGIFAQFVKQHYDEVKHLAAKERLKALGQMYKESKHSGEVAPHAKKSKALHIGGGNLLTKGLQMYGAHRGGSLMKGSNVEIMPMNLVPPSVPVDRTYTKGTAVPGAFYSGQKTYNPHEEQIALKRASEPQVMVQTPGTRMPPPPAKDDEYTDLKQMMKSFGISMPKSMRNRPVGAKISKANLSKIYQHAVDKHGEEGAGMFKRVVHGAHKHGFKLPVAFQKAMRE